MWELWLTVYYLLSKHYDREWLPILPSHGLLIKVHCPQKYKIGILILKNIYIKKMWETCCNCNISQSFFSWEGPHRVTCIFLRLNLKTFELSVLSSLCSRRFRVVGKEWDFWCFACAKYGARTEKAKRRKSSSLVFLCSPTPRKRLLLRLCAHLQIEKPGFEPWPVTLCCVLG